MKKVIDNSLLIPEISRLVEEGKSVTLKTKGNSMLPFIHGERDSVLLVKPDNINLYDIVLAEVNDSRYVIHRVVGMNENQLTLMGDGNLKECETCSFQNVIAIATEIIRGKSRRYCRSKYHLWKAKVWYHFLPVRKYLLTIYKLIDKIIGR